MDTIKRNLELIGKDRKWLLDNAVDINTRQILSTTLKIINDVELDLTCDVCNHVNHTIDTYVCAKCNNDIFYEVKYNIETLSNISIVDRTMDIDYSPCLENELLQIEIRCAGRVVHGILLCAVEYELDREYYYDSYDVNVLICHCYFDKCVCRNAYEKYCSIKNITNYFT